MEEYLDILKEMPLFKDIKSFEIKPMLECLGGFSRNYKKGNYISLSGDSIKYIGLVISGTVQMLKEDFWGNKSIYAVINSKNIFGETFVCGESESTIVSFLATEDSTVLFLPFNRVMSTCSRACEYHQKLIENMIVLIAEKNIQLMKKLEITSKKNIREKIFTYLSQQAQENDSNRFTTPLGRIELANYLCVDRSALTRELVNMKKDKIIEYDKNTFEILKY